MPESRRSRAFRIAAATVDVLRAAQRDSGLSVEMLGKEIGMSRRQLYRYWTGDAAMPLWIAVGLADTLGVDLTAVLRRNARQ